MNFSKLNDRQREIIKYAKKIESFQTKDVLAYLLNDYSVERLTIVRDLSLLTKRSILVKKGSGRGVHYQISKFYLMIRDYDVDKYFSIQHSLREAKPSFEKEVIDILSDNIFTEEEYDRLKNAQKKFSTTINSLRGQSPIIFKKEWERLVIDLSWKSSEIEGNTYTLLETEFLIKEMSFAKGKDRAEAQMILNHKEVLDYILANPNYFETIRVDKIKKIHSMLVNNIAIKEDFRNHPVGITGTIYRPLAKRDKIEQVIKQLVIKIKNTDNYFFKAFVLLIMIAYVQPFEDGNKRTSRIAANAILHANNCPMLSYRNVDAIEYKKAMLLFYEQNNISYIKKIFVEQLEFSADNYFG